MEQTFVHHKDGYATLASIQHRAASIALKFILPSINATSTTCSSNFTVCDYGAADGSNSSNIIQECFKILHQCKNVEQLTWIFNDLPYNNFEPCLHYSNEEQQERSIFTLVCAKSFYEQVLPDESIDFGLCLTAVHWLSARIERGNGIQIIPIDKVNEMNRKVAGKVGAKDWEQFLLYRGKELKQGGRMIITVPDIPDTHLLPPDEILVSVVAPELLAEGKITEYEYKHITSVFAIRRTEEDIRQPFISSESVVVKSGLHLTAIHPVKWKQDEFDHDPSCTVTEMMDFLKSYDKTFLSVLSRTRSKEAVDQISELVYERVELYLKRNPGKFTRYCNHFIVEIVKDKL